MERTTVSHIMVELATVERLDAIIAATTAAGGAGEPGALDSYTSIIDWAVDHAINERAAEEWARAERETYHHAATRGPLVLIEVDATTVRGLDGALAAAQGVVTYRPTYGTAISWFLNVARMLGYVPPGEDPDDD